MGLDPLAVRGRKGTTGCSALFSLLVPSAEAGGIEDMRLARRRVTILVHASSARMARGTPARLIVSSVEAAIFSIHGNEVYASARQVVVAVAGTTAVGMDLAVFGSSALDRDGLVAKHDDAVFSDPCIMDGVVAGTLDGR